MVNELRGMVFGPSRLGRGYFPGLQSKVPVELQTTLRGDWEERGIARCFLRPPETASARLCDPQMIGSVSGCSRTVDMLCPGGDALCDSPLVICPHSLAGVGGTSLS